MNLQNSISPRNIICVQRGVNTELKYVQYKTKDILQHTELTPIYLFICFSRRDFLNTEGGYKYASTIHSDL